MSTATRAAVCWLVDREEWGPEPSPFERMQQEALEEARRWKWDLDPVPAALPEHPYEVVP